MVRRVCLGGTFNSIHKGHLALLRKAFESGDEVYIGLTTNEMAAGSGKVKLRDYGTRLKSLEGEIERMDMQKPYCVFPLDDPMGRAATDDYDIIVVSRETARGAVEINRARERNGLRPLEIVVIDMVLAEDEKPISATRIMKGEIDSGGRVKTS